MNSYIEFPNTEGRNLDVRYSMTMLCWVYHHARTDLSLSTRRVATGEFTFLKVVNNQLFVRFAKLNYSNSFTHNLLNTPLVGGWKFVGASYIRASGGTKVWVNVDVVQTLNIGARLDLAAQKKSIRMGVKIGDARLFNSRFAHMQVYDKALSQQQKQALQQMTRAM